MRDVAEVKIGAELRQGAVTANGEGEAVAGIVLMLKGASGRDVVNAVKEKLPAIQKALPKGVELVPFYDRTDLVKKAIHTVTKALAEGAVFVLIILIVLLADVRSAIIVTLVLPLVGALRLHHDEMVGAEREPDVVRRPRHRHRHDGRWRGRDGGKHSSPSDREAGRRCTRIAHGNKVETVLYAAKEVGRPIVFGIFIIIIVFLPLFTLQGFEGKDVQPARLHDFFRAARLAHSFAHPRADALHLFPEAGAACSTIRFTSAG